jgi:hypothetical protein
MIATTDYLSRIGPGYWGPWQDPPPASDEPVGEPKKQLAFAIRSITIEK